MNTPQNSFKEESHQNGAYKQTHRKVVILITTNIHTEKESKINKNYIIEIRLHAWISTSGIKNKLVGNLNSDHMA